MELKFSKKSLSILKIVASIFHAIDIPYFDLLKMNFSPAQSRCDFNLSEEKRKNIPQVSADKQQHEPRGSREKRAGREGNHSETISLSVGLHSRRALEMP